MTHNKEDIEDGLRNEAKTNGRPASMNHEKSGKTADSIEVKGLPEKHFGVARIMLGG